MSLEGLNALTQLSTVHVAVTGTFEDSKIAEGLQSIQAAYNRVESARQATSKALRDLDTQLIGLKTIIDNFDKIDISKSGKIYWQDVQRFIDTSRPESSSITNDNPIQQSQLRRRWKRRPFVG